MAEYSKRLDRTRPFGTYHPPEKLAYYNQDGFDFTHEGKIVEANLTAAQREKLKKAPPPPPPKKAEASVADQTGDDDKSPPEETTTDTDGLNLEMWLRGQEDYPFPAVQQAVKKRLSTWKTGRRDLVLFLVEEQKLVPVDELSDEFKSLIA